MQIDAWELEILWKDDPELWEFVTEGVSDNFPIDACAITLESWNILIIVAAYVLAGEMKWHA